MSKTQTNEEIVLIQNGEGYTCYNCSDRLDAYTSCVTVDGTHFCENCVISLMYKYNSKTNARCNLCGKEIKDWEQCINSEFTTFFCFSCVGEKLRIFKEETK